MSPARMWLLTAHDVRPGARCSLHEREIGVVLIARIARLSAVARGHNALDVLDTLKLGLLDGSVDQSPLACLKVAAEGLTEGSGDSGADAVPGEIDSRVAMVLAKAGICWRRGKGRGDPPGPLSR